MNVDVMNGLMAVLAFVDQNTEPVWRQLRSVLRCNPNQFANALSTAAAGKRSERVEMRRRYDQEMDWRLRSRVPEDDIRIGAVENIRRRIFANDGTKRTRSNVRCGRTFRVLRRHQRLAGIRAGSVPRIAAAIPSTTLPATYKVENVVWPPSMPVARKSQK